MDLQSYEPKIHSQPFECCFFFINKINEDNRNVILYKKTLNKLNDNNNNIESYSQFYLFNEVPLTLILSANLPYLSYNQNSF